MMRKMFTWIRTMQCIRISIETFRFVCFYCLLDDMLKAKRLTMNATCVQLPILMQESSSITHENEKNMTNELDSCLVSSQVSERKRYTLIPVIFISNQKEKYKQIKIIIYKHNKDTAF